MTSAESSDQILKTDSLARVRTPAQRKLELLDEFERSGAQWNQIRRSDRHQVFDVCRLGGQGQTRPPGGRGAGQGGRRCGQVRWLEAVIDRAQESAGKNPCVLTVHFGGGARVDIGSLQQAMLAAALLRALEKPWPGC